jgi:hypothetical protein
MRARFPAVVCAALAGTVGFAGCRAIDGLGGLSFDVGDSQAEDAGDAGAGDTRDDSCVPANEECDASPG